MGERAERLLIIAIVGMIPGMMPFAVLAVVVISAITVAQRMRYVYGPAGLRPHSRKTTRVV